MCFAIPQRISKIKQDKAITDRGESLDSSLVAVKSGDWVLEQDRLIIAKISSKKAGSILKLLQIER